MAQAIALGALAVLLLLPMPARSDGIGTTPGCGEGPGFSLEDPQGWKRERQPKANAQSEVSRIVFRPAEAEDGPVWIDLMLVRGGSSRGTMEAALHRAVNHLLVPPEPPDIRPFAAPHPSLRTAGGVVQLSRGEAYVVAISAPGGGGRYVVARFARTSGPATPRELALFRRTIASLAIEPGVGCIARAR